VFVKYRIEAEEAFAELGFEPRPGQIEYVQKLLTAFLDEGFNDVVLNAPTGTGKSLIGAAAASALSNIKNPGKQQLASIILMHNNVLVNQYHNAFSDDPSFMQIKGAVQYRCDVLGSGYTGEDCVLPLLKKMPVEGAQLRDTHCSNCEYKCVRENRNNNRHLITNYSYFFIDRLYSKMPLEKRQMMIFDEAHVLNDAFTDHNAIHFSTKSLIKNAEELSTALKSFNPQVYKTFKEIKALLQDGDLGQHNYIDVLTELNEAYSSAANALEKELTKSISSFEAFSKFSRLHKKYYGLGCKIDDLLKYKYEHVIQPAEDEFTVKPIFIGKMFDRALRISNYNLFMSATITGKLLTTTLGLDQSKLKVIQLPPTFPPKNKKVIFYKPVGLSYKTMQDEKTMSQIDANALAITKHHEGKQEKGIIQTPSFALASRIAAKLKKANIKNVIEHQRGEQLSPLLFRLKETKEFAVLISPSLFEGVDLPDDASRFQIIVKAPYASLGDNRIKYIAENHKDIYSLNTILKIVQGCGRSVRSQNDHCTTYFLDNNIRWLWNSDDNIWKNEFETKYTTLLESDED